MSASSVRAAALFFAVSMAFGCATVQQPSADRPMVVVPFERAPFTSVDLRFPDGAQIAVLWGDPSSGPSAMLIKSEKGPFPLHSHSSDYHLVVLRGTVKHWEEGHTEDQAQPLAPGSYWFQPGNKVHGDSCLADECVVQIVWLGKRDAKLAPTRN
jgi:hypothetical protein